MQKTLTMDPNLKYTRMQTIPYLTEIHLWERVISTRKHLVDMQTDWNTIILSDKKRFDLDGPDGMRIYGIKYARNCGNFTVGCVTRNSVLVLGSNLLPWRNGFSRGGNEP